MHCVRNHERALNDKDSSNWTGFMESSSEGGSRANEVKVNMEMVGSQDGDPTMLMGDSSRGKKRTAEMFESCAGMVFRDLRMCISNIRIESSLDAVGIW